MALLRVFIHNVGHGQAVHVITPSGQVAVIDLGCSCTFSPLRWLKKEFGKIDRLVVTHPHTDHIDEIALVEQLDLRPKILSRPVWLSEAAIRVANRGTDSAKVDVYLRLNTAYSQPVLPGTGAPTDVEFETFFPRGCSDSNINNFSAVTYVGCGGWGFIFPGDNEPPSWRELLDNERFRARLATTQIFMASHHARESGYCAELFDVLNPRLCVVSDREVQDTDVADRYSQKATGLKVERLSGALETRSCVTTRSDGAIAFTIDPLTTNLRVFVSV